MDPDQLLVRPASASDIDAISRIMNRPPEPPSAAALGPELASRLGDLLVRAGINLSLPRAAVAVLGEEVVGVIDAGPSQSRVHGVADMGRLLARALVIIGPVQFPRVVYAFYLQRRVQFGQLPGVFQVDQLYVDEGFRNRGIGGRLLAHADDLARAARFSRMCIETGINNPARRLYERHGYRVALTKVDARYERLTLSPGRVQMLKDLELEDPVRLL